MKKFIARVSPFIAATALIASMPVTTAVAQTASDLNCHGCVGKSDIGKKAVVTRAIKKGAVKAKSIRDGAVEESKLDDGAVTPDKLAEGAKPAGLDSASVFGAMVDLEQTSKIMTTVEIDAPGAGSVAVFAGGLVIFATGSNLVGCSLTTGTEFSEESGLVFAGDSGSFDAYRIYSRMRVFPVTEGPNTFNLVCIKDGGGDVKMSNIEATALFVPASY